MFTRKLPNGEHLYVIVYVDDCVVIGPTDYATSFIQTIGKLIDIKVLGRLKRYNGGDYKFDKDMKTLTITQTDLIMKLAKDMKLIDTKTPGSSNVIQEKYSGDTAVNLKLYQQKVGVILYITKTSRPDIANQARELSQFMSHPGPEHWKLLQKTISYLYSTMEIGLTLGAIDSSTRIMTVTGYCDSDFASNKDDRRSVTGYIVKLNGYTVAWKSKKQTSTTLSRTEAEYVALSQCACEIKFMHQLLRELGITINVPIIIREDNAGAIFISGNSVVGQQTKHIDTRCHFIHELVERNLLKITHISTDLNPADLFTKNVSLEKYCLFSSIVISPVLEIEKKGRCQGV